MLPIIVPLNGDAAIYW